MQTVGPRITRARSGHPGVWTLILLFGLLQAGCGDPGSSDDMDADHYSAWEDCNDYDSQIHPGAEDAWYDGVDSNCDGRNDWDADGDGHTIDTFGGDDCDDADPSIYGGAEDTWYDGVDSDCDGWSDYDADLDGYDASTYGGEDCDDGNAAINPGADEWCDWIDNDCDGIIDGENALDDFTWYPDADGDGYGDSSAPLEACLVPSGYVFDGTDCDDDDPAVNIEMEEICSNGLDDDCDGVGCWPSGTMYVTSAEAILSGESVADGAGFSVSGAGDVDGDGYADILVGAYHNDAGGLDAGAAYLLLGPVSGHMDLSYADARFTGERPGDSAGVSVSGAGDMDADGFSDLVIAAVGNDSGGDDAGAVYGFFGPVTESMSLAEADFRLRGEASGDSAGCAVSNAGDVDGDGFSDIIVGADYDDSGGENSGAVYLVRGPISGDLGLWGADAKLFGEEDYDHAGDTISTAGDLDGDGFADLLIGAPDQDPHGRSWAGAAYVVTGPVTGMLDLEDADAKIYGEDDADMLGKSVADAGDVNGDGLADIIIGADGHGSLSGAAYLLFGAPSGEIESTDADARIFNNAALEMLGRSVSSAGDVDADGFADVLVGAYESSYGFDGGGTVYLLLGPLTGRVNVGGAEAQIIGEAHGDEAGTALATAGDVFDDGFTDILVASFKHDDRTGIVYLFDIAGF